MRAKVASLPRAERDISTLCDASDDELTCGRSQYADGLIPLYRKVCARGVAIRARSTGEAVVVWCVSDRPAQGEFRYPSQPISATGQPGLPVVRIAPKGPRAIARDKPKAFS
jgi:hypothetical protein